MRHKKRVQNRRKSSAGSSSGNGWAWLLFGVFLGGILGSIGYVKWYEGRPHTVPPVVQAKKVVKAPKPQFDFYTILPGAEVEQPRKPNAAPVPKAPPALATAQSASATPSKPAQVYRLQLASYKSFPEADALKARLALSGFAVEIQSVRLEHGVVWYRVQTPPLASEQEALKMQSALKSQTIKSVLINTKG